MQVRNYDCIRPFSRHRVEALPTTLGDINIKYFSQASLRDLHKSKIVINEQNSIHLIATPYKTGYSKLSSLG
jgi:hypothetical protein